MALLQPFNQAQIETVEETTHLAIESGFVLRYHQELRTLAMLGAKVLDAAELLEVADAYQPIAFLEQPHDTCESLWVIKVDPIAGRKMKRSELMIGDHANGRVERLSIGHGFVESDMTFASGRLAAQRAVHLEFSL